MTIIVIHRPNRYADPRDLRLCRRTFVREDEARDYCWRRGRAGAVMIRRASRGVEGMIATRLRLPHYHDWTRGWVPIGELVRVRLLSVLEVELAFAMADVSFTPEGGIRS